MFWLSFVISHIYLFSSFPIFFNVSSMTLNPWSLLSLLPYLFLYVCIFVLCDLASIHPPSKMKALSTVELNYSSFLSNRAIWSCCSLLAYCLRRKANVLCGSDVQLILIVSKECFECSSFSRSHVFTCLMLLELDISIALV